MSASIVRENLPRDHWCTQDESITPIERPTEGLVCNMPVVIEEKQKSTLKRPFEALNVASKECGDTDSLEGPVLSKRSKNAEVLSASTNITITEKLIPPVSNKTFKSNGLLASADKQMNVDLWPPLEPDRFAGLLLLESSGASFLSIFENSFRLCGLQNYFYQCVPWGKGHICRLFVSNKMLAVEEGSSPDIAMEATAKIAVKRLINYHYILKIKPNMSLDQLVARPTLPTKKTNVTSVHSSSRSDNKNHSSSRSDNKDHSSSQSDNKDHSSSQSDNKAHSSSRSDNKDHSSSRSDNKDHSSSRSDNKDHSSSRSDNKDHSSSRSDNKDHSSSRSDNKDHSSSRSDNKDHSSSRSDNKDFPVFSNTGTRVINKSGRNFRKRYKKKFVQVGKRLVSSACPRESNQTRPAGIGTNVLNNSVSPIFLSWAQSIVKHAGKYSHNLVFSPLFSREELDIIKRVGQKADLRPSFRGSVEGEDLQLVLGRDIWTIARELLRVGGHNDNYQLIPPRNMGTHPSPICHSTTSNQKVPNSTQDSTTSNPTPAELDLKTFEAGPGIGAPSVSKEESTLKSKNQEPGIATLASSKQEVTVKLEHSINKDQEMATLSTSEHEITVKQEHSDEKAREMMTLQSDKQENPCGLEHLFDPTLSPLFLTGPFGRLVVVDEFTTNYQKILTTTASSNKIILARQFGRMPSGLILCRISLNNQLLATGKGAFQVIAAADAAQQSVKILQQHYYTIKANCKYWSHKVVHPSMISPAGSLEELVHQLAEQMGWKPSQEVVKSSRTSTGLLTFPRSFREWGEVLIETYKHIESWEDLTFSPDFSSEDKTVLARIALESGLLCRRVKTSNFLLLVVSKQFFLSKVIKSLITFPELNNKYQLIPPEIIPQLEVKDSELDKAMNSPEDEHQMLCDPAKTKPLKDPLNCRVIESSTKTCDNKPKTFDEKHKTFDDKPKTCDEKHKTFDEKPKTCDEKPKMCDEKPKTFDEKPKTCDEKPKTCDEKPKTCDEKPKTCDEKPKACDEKPVALSSKLVGVDGKHSFLRNNLRTNLSSKCTLTNRPSFLKDPHLARVLPYGDYGQMVLSDSCDLGAVIEDVMRSLSESCIDYKIVHEKPTARGSKRKEKECGLNLNTCRILIGGKTVTVGQHKKMRSATVIAAKKLMTKLKSQHFFVKGPRPRILPVPFIPDEKAFVSYAEKLLQEYSREETSSALVLKTDLGTKKEKILGRIAKKLDLKIYHSQPNIHFLVITKLTNFWTLVKLLASGEQNVNYKLIAPPS